MAKRITPLPPFDLDILEKEIETRVTDDAGWKTFACELVTPMYGGGVVPGKVDSEMPIRASAIRGQLRFWWRMACGPFASSQIMFERETAIWGGIGDKVPTASQVEVRIRGEKLQTNNLISSSAEGNPAIKYAFGSASINGSADWLKAGYPFQLELRYPAGIGAEVESALRWWANFGGVGARTRRGFGAVHVSGVQALLPADIQSVGGCLTLASTESAKPDSEWKTAIGRLFAFRQKDGIARRDGNPRPGRSFWPEPDQIRRFTGRNANGKHEPTHPAGNVFPRAAFGLPITFEFKGSPGEPPKLELHPEGDSDRMASPLILRPYWNGTQWQPAALLLPGWKNALKQPLKFKDRPYQPKHWPTDVAERKRLADQIGPMKGHGDDPLSAFMHFFEKGQ